MPELTTAEARRRFAAARVASLATIGEAGPHLVPVVFALAGDVLVTAVDHKPKRTPKLRRLADIAADPAVCLLVDCYHEDWTRLWWVRAEGDARLLPPDAPQTGVASEHRDAIALLTAKYAQYRQRPPDGTVIRVTVRRWLGWCASLG